MKIYEIIMEARAESLATKYKDKILGRAKGDRHSGVSDETDILSFVQNLESKYSKYTEWVLVRWLQDDFLIEDMPRVEAAIAEFDAKKRGLEKKDINQYQTLNELEDAVGLLDHIKSARQQKQEIKTTGIRKIVDNDSILLAQILTEEAAILVGRGTAWCTAYTEHDNKFNEYNSQGPVYILIDKSTNEKFQIHYQTAQVKDSYNEDYDYQKLLKIAPQLKQLEPESPREFFGIRALFRFIIRIKKESWPAAERYIMVDSKFAYVYARDILERQWLEAEPYIMNNPSTAYWYARDVLKRRWLEAEPVIMEEEFPWLEYKKHFGIK